ncbi:hypothetical protein BDV95DRAFT_467768, partial [Massariosphaeria phaeospora]
MGGHAFHDLHTPRIPPALYLAAREKTTAILRLLFARVVVPTELPEKPDYGDIDYLVCEPLPILTSSAPSSAAFPWAAAVRTLKEVLDTPHGNRGFHNPDVIFLAMRPPVLDPTCCSSAAPAPDFWIQVDVKVCEDPERFEWQRLQLNYASGAKMLSSMGKPLGLTMNPEGLWVRVEDMEGGNWAGSMVWLSKETGDALKVFRLDGRWMAEGGFKGKEEIYTYLTNSWLFNPAHFGARLRDEKFVEHIADRSAPWVSFIKTWIPEHYPKSQDHEKDWYKTTRSAVREKVFTMFPPVASTYYEK